MVDMHLLRDRQFQKKAAVVTACVVALSVGVGLTVAGTRNKSLSNHDNNSMAGGNGGAETEITDKESRMIDNYSNVTGYSDYGRAYGSGGNEHGDEHGLAHGGKSGKSCYYWYSDNYHGSSKGGKSEHHESDSWSGGTDEYHYDGKAEKSSKGRRHLRAVQLQRRRLAYGTNEGSDAGGKSGKIDHVDDSGGGKSGKADHVDDSGGGDWWNAGEPGWHASPEPEPEKLHWHPEAEPEKPHWYDPEPEHHPPEPLHEALPPDGSGDMHGDDGHWVYDVKECDDYAYSKGSKGLPTPPEHHSPGSGDYHEPEPQNPGSGDYHGPEPHYPGSADYHGPEPHFPDEYTAPWKNSHPEPKPEPEAHWHETKPEPYTPPSSKGSKSKSSKVADGSKSAKGSKGAKSSHPEPAVGSDSWGKSWSSPGKEYPTYNPTADWLSPWVPAKSLWGSSAPWGKGKTDSPTYNPTLSSTPRDTPSDSPSDSPSESPIPPPAPPVPEPPVPEPAPKLEPTPNPNPNPDPTLEPTPEPTPEPVEIIITSEPSSAPTSCPERKWYFSDETKKCTNGYELPESVAEQFVNMKTCCESNFMVNGNMGDCKYEDVCKEPCPEPPIPVPVPEPEPTTPSPSVGIASPAPSPCPDRKWYIELSDDGGTKTCTNGYEIPDNIEGMTYFDNEDECCAIEFDLGDECIAVNVCIEVTEPPSTPVPTFILTEEPEPTTPSPVESEPTTPSPTPGNEVITNEPTFGSTPTVSKETTGPPTIERS